MFVMGATQFASGISIGNITLDKVDGPSKVLIGLIATSVLTTTNEFKKAIDNTDPAKKPDFPSFSKLFRKPAPKVTEPAAVSAVPATSTVPSEWVEEVRLVVKGVRAPSDATLAGVAGTVPR